MAMLASQNKGDEEGISPEAEDTSGKVYRVVIAKEGACFKNQGDCVSFVATEGKDKPGK